MPSHEVDITTLSYFIFFVKSFFKRKNIFLYFDGHFFFERGKRDPETSSGGQERKRSPRFARDDGNRRYMDPASSAGGQKIQSLRGFGKNPWQSRRSLRRSFHLLLVMTEKDRDRRAALAMTRKKKSEEEKRKYRRKSVDNGVWGKYCQEIFFFLRKNTVKKKSMSDDESQFYYDERKASVGASLFLPRILFL
ncbi:hypothetical protein CSB09_02085 [Candidatus Gracilibacteria bacterium]|nr:MAG: hypothetical protein CSB09_02085 [Candidatus Gracilibacteria bacterium]